MLNKFFQSFNEKEDKIIVEPLKVDLVEAGKGILKTKGKILRRLIEDRKDEAEL